MFKRKNLFILVLGLYGCSVIEPKPFESSDGHIRTQSAPKVVDIPELVEQVPVVPEPGKPESRERYTVVVNEVPVKELLFALAREARINVDIHPDITGNVTINAVDQTLPKILKRISGQVALRYEYDGASLSITRDMPYLHTYKVDYVNMSRETGNTNTIATQITSASSGGGSGSNNSMTDIKGRSVHHFWETLVENVSAIIGVKAGDSSNNAVVAASESGLLTVRANASQHVAVQAFLDLSLASVKRQVLIRVMIAEVTLNENYQAGVDWALITRDGKAGFDITSTTLTSRPVGVESSFVLSYVDPNLSRDERLIATVRLLDEFGDTRILSSPQLMVLNNQTAILKVVENIVYFEVDAELTPSTVAGGEPVTSIDTTAQTVPVGIVMAVTPQISAGGEVVLNVRPTISSVARFVNDPNPEIRVGSDGQANPVPQIQIREMESILRLQDGQIGVLGGLMQNRRADDDKGLPGLKKLPLIGVLFKERTINDQKTELVIFLQPLIVNTPSIETDLDLYKRYLRDVSVLSADSKESN